MIFDIPIFVDKYVKSKGVTPVFADKTFWSDMLMSRP
jgi:hypothetical protein